MSETAPTSTAVLESWLEGHVRSLSGAARVLDRLQDTLDEDRDENGTDNTDAWLALDELRTKLTEAADRAHSTGAAATVSSERGSVAVSAGTGQEGRAAGLHAAADAVEQRRDTPDEGDGPLVWEALDDAVSRLRQMAHQATQPTLF